VDFPTLPNIVAALPRHRGDAVGFNPEKFFDTIEDDVKTLASDPDANGSQKRR
jgi:hypothetical protein